MKDAILVVEGIPELRKEIEVCLADDYRICSVPNYLEALSALPKLAPEMAIVNASLPVIDGWEACRELAKDFGLPVMLLGKISDETCWEKAIECGADFYLRLPFARLEIQSRIRAILRRTRRIPLPPSFSRQPIRKQA